MNLVKSLNLPNFLTLFRLLVSPIILPVLLVYYLPKNIYSLNITFAIIFLLISLTDFLDGYLARKYHIVTKFGQALDPIADKFLICFTLISLLAIGKIFFLWVILLIGREFFVMGLRQIALENNFFVPVSMLAKLKMNFQVLMIVIIIMNPDHYLSISQSGWNIAEIVLILITIFLSLFSALQYYLAFHNLLKF